MSGMTAMEIKALIHAVQQEGSPVVEARRDDVELVVRTALRDADGILFHMRALHEGMPLMKVNELVLNTSEHFPVNESDLDDVVERGLSVLVPGSLRRLMLNVEAMMALYIWLSGDSKEGIHESLVFKKK